MQLALVAGALALQALLVRQPRTIPVHGRRATPRMSFLGVGGGAAGGSFADDLAEAVASEASPSGAVVSNGADLPDPGQASWVAAVARLAELRAMQDEDAGECVIECPCLSAGGIVLLRHGESEWNAQNRFTGWYDVPLTPRGEREALDAADTLRSSGVCVDMVFTSTLKRTIKTAWLVLEALDKFTVPVYQRWRLNERMYGELTGLNKADTRAWLGDAPFEQLRRTPPPLERGSCFDPASSLSLRSLVAAGSSGGVLEEGFGGAVPRGGRVGQVPTAESFEDTRDRVLPCWQEEILPQALAGKTVLVISSKNTLRSLIQSITGMPMQHAVDLDIPNGVPIVFYPETRSLTLVGSDLPLGSVPPEVANDSRAVAASAAAAAAAVPVLDATSVLQGGLGDALGDAPAVAGKRERFGAWLRRGGIG